jgi:hypothetical protein
MQDEENISLSKLTMQEINDAFSVIAPTIDQAWNEALDDDALWWQRVRVQSRLTCPWYIPLELWRPVVSVRQWRLRRMLKRMSR